MPTFIDYDNTESITTTAPSSIYVYSSATWGGLVATQWNAAVKPPFTVLFHREHTTESQISKAAMDNFPCEDQPS